MAILPLLSEVCDRPVVYQDLCSWDLGEALNIDETTMTDTWKRILNTDLLRHAPPIDGAIEGLSALSKYEVWLVTSRPISMKELTLSWLRENGASYDHIVFGKRGNKLSVGPAFNIFVEDFIEEASVIAEAGIFTILFNQPWNNDSELPKNCVRAFDWNSILLFINDYEKSTQGYARD
jgi:uncharacterized HAD superfamily protein